MSSHDYLNTTGGYGDSQWVPLRPWVVPPLFLLPLPSEMVENRRSSAVNRRNLLAPLQLAVRDMDMMLLAVASCPSLPPGAPVAELYHS